MSKKKQQVGKSFTMGKVQIFTAPTDRESRIKDICNEMQKRPLVALHKMRELNIDKINEKRVDRTELKPKTQAEVSGKIRSLIEENKTSYRSELDERHESIVRTMERLTELTGEDFHGYRSEVYDVLSRLVRKTNERNRDIR